jgi:hypothetical protein
MKIDFLIYKEVVFGRKSVAPTMHLAALVDG